MSREAQVRASEQMRDRIANYLHGQGVARAGNTSRKDLLLFAMERVVRAINPACQRMPEAMGEPLPNNVIAYERGWQPAARQRRAAEIAENMPDIVRLLVVGIGMEPLRTDGDQVDRFETMQPVLDTLVGLEVVIRHERLNGHATYRLTALG
jgi:hypothetical protein